MTVAVSTHAMPRTMIEAPSPSLFASPRIMLCLGLILGVSLGWRTILPVWQMQTFFDTDDAMHLVQVRDWLNGQGWFDMVAPRLGLAGGTLMHWTHVEDLPMAGLIRFFGLFAPLDTAERLSRIAYPMLLLAALFYATIRVARELAGPVGIGVAVILTAGSITVGVQFAPGRITHHHIEIVLLMVMVGATVAAFDPARGLWSGVVAGVSAALAMAISLEDLPFIAAMVVTFGFAWLVRGAPARAATAAFGASLALGTTAAFLLTVPPALYARDFSDVLSRPQLTGAVASGLCLLLLAALGPRLTGAIARLIAATVLGGLVLILMVLVFPRYIGDPFAGADPLVHRVWMDNIGENQPLGRLIWKGDRTAASTAGPPLLGFACLCLACLLERGPARGRWAAVAAFAGVGILGAFWQVRVATSVAPIALLGGVWLFTRLKSLFGTRGLVLSALPALLAIPFAAAAWATAIPVGPDAPSPFGDPGSCFASSAYTALRALPDATLLTPIDSGPYVLAFTNHRVIAGPYHRDEQGIRLAIEAFTADPARARAIVHATGAAYVALCRPANELGIYADAAPRGFAASLRNGVVPDWLTPVAILGTPFKVYRVR